MTDTLYLPFFHATRDVFELMLDIHAVANKEKDDTASITGIRIAIGVTGALSGEIVYCFPSATALEMVRIMSGMNFEELDDFVTSAIGEIANIISGKALVFLSEQNVTCDILPPKATLLDENNRCNAGAGSTCISTEIGTVGLTVNLKQ